MDENRPILTHDSDFGELIFKYGFKPKAGVIYFRLDDFVPSDPGELVFDIIQLELTLANRLTVITDRLNKTTRCCTYHLNTAIAYQPKTARKSLSSPLRFYFDENIAAAIAKGVRRRGIDVVTVARAGKLEAFDEEHLAFARQNQRVIVTHDTYFLRLAAAAEDHSGKRKQCALPL